MSSPTTLFLSGEVDLEIIRVIVDVEEAAALVELTDTADRRVDKNTFFIIIILYILLLNHPNTFTVQVKTALTNFCNRFFIPNAFDGHCIEVPLMDPFL